MLRVSGGDRPDDDSARLLRGTSAAGNLSGTEPTKFRDHTKLRPTNGAAWALILDADSTDCARHPADLRCARR